MIKNPDDERLRLDELLVRRGLFASRSRARDAVLRGTVRVNGQSAKKPGTQLPPESMVETDDAGQKYVSRAALKLAAGLDHFALTPEGRSCLDIGASTGGFTQVLLERGAAHVTAIDVGHGQMHASLLSDPRIFSFEGLNARDLTREQVEGLLIGFVVSDVSFISLKLALPKALELSAPGAQCLLLVKPQFEIGREAIGRGGLLKDKSMGERVAQDLSGWLGTQPNWRSLGFCASPIEGGDGNREFLLAGIKDR